MIESRGTYIVIEGNDGTGKSTQVQQLTQALKEHGHDAVMIEEPGSEDPTKSTPFANYMREIIKDGNEERSAKINVALFSAARHELWKEIIEPTLSRNGIVLSARNYLSTIAYQGKGEGLDENYITEKTLLATDERYISPDLMLVLTLEDEAERAKRIGGRGALETPDTFEQRDEAFQARVNQAYVDLARERNLPTISCLDGSRSKTIDEIQEEIRLQPVIASLLK